MIRSFLILWLAVLTAPACAQGLDSVISLYERGKFQGAADIITGLVRQSPGNPTLRLWAGKTLFKLRRWDDAIREFKKAVDLDPKNGVYALWLGRANGRKAEHAFALAAIAPAGRARDNFEIAVRLAPDNIDARFDLLDFYSQAPGIMGGGRSKAEAQAAEIARISPRAGFAARAMIYGANKEWDKARQELWQATQQYPDSAEAHVDLAWFQLERKDYGGAEASARKACALAGANRKARLALAAAHIELKSSLPDGLQTLQELSAGPLTDDDPSFEQVYYWLGRAHLALGQKPEARRALQASLSFDPEYRQSKEALTLIR